MNKYECEKCADTGAYVYGSTAMNMGIGGQVVTMGPCPGTRNRPDLSDCPTTLAVKAEEERPCIGKCGRITNGYFYDGTSGPGWYCGWCEAIPGPL